ncbi:ribonuclease H2, subunit B, partial [Halteromyces radiatus]|uniref:ribonuclease H2, subunit B n=1 Tax=Halteromyces radiatus TaxID=101107 RepID=UPI002220935B
VNSFVQVTLPCPRTAKLSSYLYDANTAQIYELSKVAEGRKTCWLINHTIYKDGSIHFVTPMDPLFIALPILDQAGQKINQQEDRGLFRTIDDIFTSEQGSSFMDMNLLINITTFSEQLSHLCDTQEISPGTLVYRFNEEKSLNWLRKK